MQHMTTAPGRPKAHSYVRFSTPEQALGDSLRRQIERAREWRKANERSMDTAPWRTRPTTKSGHFSKHSLSLQIRCSCPGGRRRRPRPNRTSGRG
jgi:hypothetical protein